MRKAIVGGGIDPVTDLLPEGYRLDLLDCRDQTPDDGAKAWLLAESFGFHGTRDGADDLATRWAHLHADASRVRAVYADGRATPYDDGWPVATFRSFDGTVNTGTSLASSSFIADVTVRASHRRRGLLRAMMMTDLTDAHERGLPFASLTASEGGIYGHFGFGVAVQSLRVKLQQPRDLRWWREPDRAVDLVGVEAAAPIRQQLFDRWHERTRGSHSRASSYAWWLDQRPIVGDKPGNDLYTAVHLTATGDVDGLLTYRFSGEEFSRRTLAVCELVALGSDAELALWGYACSHDLVATVTGPAAIDSPLLWAPKDARAVQVEGLDDAMWLRILDVPHALQLRSWDADGRVVLRVADPMGFADGTWQVAVADGRATVSATSAEPDVWMQTDALASLYTGVVRVGTLAAAGRVDRTADGIARADALFATTTAPRNASFF